MWDGTQHVEVTDDWITMWTWWVFMVIFWLFSTEEEGGCENEGECEKE